MEIEYIRIKRLNLDVYKRQMKSQSFEQLIVWQKAHSYVLAIYKITKQYPKEELFCLVNQMGMSDSQLAVIQFHFQLLVVLLDIYIHRSSSPWFLPIPAKKNIMVITVLP